MTDNSVIASTDTVSETESNAEGDSRNKKLKADTFWFNCAIFGLASGAAALLFGLCASFAVWTQSGFPSDSKISVVGIWLVAGSLLLFFFGGYCLDKAYDCFYCRQQFRTKFNFTDNAKSQINFF